MFRKVGRFLIVAAFFTASFFAAGISRGQLPAAGDPASRGPAYRGPASRPGGSDKGIPCLVDSDCDDSVGCTVDVCNQATNTCVNTPKDALCDNGIWCDGAETCDAVAGCQEGTAPDCDDGVACTVDGCNEEEASCDNLPKDALCDDGDICDGAETCDPVAGCQEGTPPTPPPPSCDGGPGGETRKRIFWSLYKKRCPIADARADLVIEAGDYGVFYFKESRFRQCRWMRRIVGREWLRYYPTPGPSREAVPCLAGAGCDNSLDLVEEPWVAVIDWDNWHGRSVDWVLRGSTQSAVETVLLDLKIVVPGGRGVTDVEVIARLAEIIQAIDVKDVPVPEVVNMSFGRLRQPDDADDTSCDRRRLSCQVARLLGHLARSGATAPNRPGTVMVAAAGNHGESLFPGSIQGVVATGALDLQQLALAGDVDFAWETPAGAQALMPGAGICLRQGSGDTALEMPLPAGSSFSAAIYSGWLTEALKYSRDLVLDRLQARGLWTPWQSCEAPTCPYYLVQGDVTFPSPSGRASQRVVETVYDNPAFCGTVRGGRLDPDLLPAADPTRGLSLVEWMASEHRPAPEPDPCVPCSLCRDLERQEPGTPGTTVTVPLAGDIDLHSAWRMPQNTRLDALYLRLGQEYWLFDLAPSQRKAIAVGDVGFLGIDVTLHNPDLSAQPSLVSLITIDPGTPEEGHFWHATPLIFHH